MAAEIVIKGDKEAIAMFQRFPGNITDEFVGVLETEGEEVLQAAQERVPFLTGDLHDSGKKEVTREGDQVTLRVSFGNDDVDYAVVVHEDLEAVHPRGQAKYLETVWNERENQIVSALARSVEHAARRSK